MNQSPHIIAICYIAKNDDQSNKCSLSNEHLYIKRKGKAYSFDLEGVISLVLKQKRLLFPLVVGGIVGSLFLIAGFNFLINIWISMIIGLAGMLVFYYGYVGSKTLTVTTNLKEYDIFINHPTPPLEGFVSLVNEYFTLGKSKNIIYYLPLLEETWQMAIKTGHIDTPVTGLRLFSTPYENKGRIVLINPLEVSNIINYILEESSNKVVPYIFGKIDVNNLREIEQ